MRRSSLLALALSLGLLATPWAESSVERPGSAVERSMRAALSGSDLASVETEDLGRWRKSLLALYERRGFAPLWFSGNRLSRSGEILLDELRAAGGRGLRPEDYGGDHLANLARQLEHDAAAPAEQVARFDLTFSLVVARFAVDLHAGRVDPRTAGHDLDVPHATRDVEELLRRLAGAAEPRAALDDLEPDLRHYDLLKASLARYRELASESGVNALPAPGRRSIAPGEMYPGAPKLRRLLRLLGDLRAPAVPPVEDAAFMDRPLVAALARFQMRHGLEPDGVLGPATMRELTTPLSYRALQIRLSLERIRWLPAFASPPVIVNIPQFKLFAFRSTEDSARDILQMDVIVGAAFPGRRTPVFAGQMRHVVLRPYWDVPYSIMKDEMLPGIRADPAWIVRNGYEIVRGARDDALPQPVTPESIDGLARGELRLRQKPGADNSLGLVKFMFPNRHNVYLHDTPARELFRHSRRAFSHGCIRVADPLGLIAHVLRGEPDWTAERVAAAMSSDGPTRIRLRKPVPVFILYGTAIATEAGETLFFRDIYGHDARLAQLLAARPARPTRPQVQASMPAEFIRPRADRK